ncbi:MAG: hypothetical protein F4153_03780 [Acidimicrobiia bacterium]|nr:hypothetical protein [Acidimicrobiia bacterium]
MSAQEDDSGVWDDLIGAAKLLTWRRITQPQPAPFNQAICEGAQNVSEEVKRLRRAVADESLLDEVEAAATAVAEMNSFVGTLLLRSIMEVGSGSCVVVAINRPTQMSVEDWLSEYEVLVLTPGELGREQPPVDLAYAIGPPRLFNSALVTAPVTSEVNFYIPDWFADRTVPQSAIAKYAEGAVTVSARVHTEGVASEIDHLQVIVDDDFLPKPDWGTRQSPDREPGSDEVEAHKVLMSGNHSVWLDDGDRIRALDPSQPAGERVAYIPVDAVRPGTYLLLRQGATEHGALYQEVLSQLGGHSGVADDMQSLWKNRLAGRLAELGYGEVVSRLKARGVRTAERAQAWVDPNLIRPLSDHDFELLLEWLGIQPQDTLENATRLRKMLYKVSAGIRKELEAAVSAAELLELERTGYLSLRVETEGIRGILAARVLAISPFSEIKLRRDTRVPFRDKAGRWLE